MFLLNRSECCSTHSNEWHTIYMEICGNVRCLYKMFKTLYYIFTSCTSNLILKIVIASPWNWNSWEWEHCTWTNIVHQLWSNKIVVKNSLTNKMVGEHFVPFSCIISQNTKCVTFTFMCLFTCCECCKLLMS